jgi:hypothetical protein
MQCQTTPTRSHTAEPAPGSFRAAKGGDADLFNLDHYPVRATCRLCDESILAETFLSAFKHEDSRRPDTSRIRN